MYACTGSFWSMLSACNRDTLQRHPDMVLTLTSGGLHVTAMSAGHVAQDSKAAFIYTCNTSIHCSLKTWHRWRCTDTFMQAITAHCRRYDMHFAQSPFLTCCRHPDAKSDRQMVASQAVQWKGATGSGLESTHAGSGWGSREPRDRFHLLNQP